MDGTDEEVLAAYVAGNPAAFEELSRRYVSRVYAICLRYFRNVADAEDATQETFVAVLRRGSTFAGGAAFSTWLYRVATNACNDLARKRARRPQVSLETAKHVEPVDFASPDELLDRRVLRPDLQQALNALDVEYRTVVLLADVAGLPYAAIAERLALPLGTVKSRLHRGHARLAASLAAAGQRGAEHSPQLREPSGTTAPPTVQP